MKRVISLLLVMIIIVGSFSVGLVCSYAESDGNEETFTITKSDINSFNAILTNSCFVWGNQKVDFSKISLEELILQYIMLDGVPVGLYTSFFDFDYSQDLLIDKRDPQRKFFAAYRMNAENVDWIIKNVFGRNPDRTIVSTKYYYDNNYLYRLADLGGGLENTFIVTNYKYLGDGKYRLTAKSHNSVEGDTGFVMSIIASLVQSSSGNRYWRLYQLNDKVITPSGKIDVVKSTARTANAEKIVWSKIIGSQGYQVQISTKDGKRWDKAYYAKGTNAIVIKGLAGGSAYKFRVRPYALDDGEYYFGAWSRTLTSPTLPSGTTLTKLTPAKKAFTAQWKKNASVNGYQVQYGVKSNFSGAKTLTVKNAKTLKAAVKKLSAKKVYYVRIRTYKTISKANYFSTWSKTYKVKTK